MTNVNQCPDGDPHDEHDWTDKQGFDFTCLGLEAPPEEPRYTLDEAKLIFMQQACAASGHEWTLGGNAQRVPVIVYCARGCGAPSGTITFPVPQPEETP